MLNRVLAKGFLSWEDLDFEINQGITQIDGFNFDDDTPEGSGKSAIMNAICWGCFGKIPKDANVDDVLKEGSAECGVNLLFDDFSIIRSRKSGRGELYMENEFGQVVKGKDAKETQDLINEKLGLTFETFCQTVYFAQDYDKKFITSNQEDKGKILSEIQDLKIFDKARKEVQELEKIEKSKLQKLESDLTLAKQSLNFTFEKIQMKNNFIESQKKDIQDKINQVLISKNNHEQVIQKAYDELVALSDEYNNTPDIIVEDQISSIESDIQQLEAAKQEINQQLASVAGILQQQKFLRDQLNSLHAQDNKIISKIQKLEQFIQNPTKNCPTCGTLLEQADTSHAENEVEVHKSELLENVVKMDGIRAQIDSLVIPDSKEASDQISQINVAIKECRDAITKLHYDAHGKNLLYEKVQSKNQSYESLTSQLSYFDQQISELESKSFHKDEAEIESLKKEHKVKDGQLLVLGETIDSTKIYMQRLEMLKDGFKEIKSYVFNGVLAELTVKSNKYLSDLFHVPVSIKFTNDDMKIGTSIKYDGKERAYGLLSGGQAKRVSIATDLALSEIISRRKNNKLNFRCFDEPFKNLSESSMVKCVDLFQKLSGSTLLIEHNSMVKPIANQVFEVELRDGTSRAK